MNRVSLLAANGSPVSTGPTCGGCRWMKNRQRQPAAPGGIPDLSAPVFGQCQAMPPQNVVQPTAQGMQIIGSAYPPVCETNPACGQYATE